MKSVIGSSSHPSSIAGTSIGQAWLVTRTSGARARIARSYAPLRIVPRVPMTPTCPLRVDATAARAPGTMTPVTGALTVCSNRGMPSADAVLHATTIIFAPAASSNLLISTEYRSMVVWLLPP